MAILHLVLCLLCIWLVLTPPAALLPLDAAATPRARYLPHPSATLLLSNDRSPSSSDVMRCDDDDDDDVGGCFQHCRAQEHLQ